MTSKSLLEVISNANNMSLVEKIDGDDVDGAEKTDNCRRTTFKEETLVSDHGKM